MCALFTGYFIVFRNREHLIGSRPQAAAIPPGRGGTTKMIRKMREEELIVYIYLKSSDKYRKYLNLTSYSYTQKKEQSPDILTQQISVDSDCANDGCVALFERSEFAKAVIDRCAGRIRKCRVSKSQETVLFFVI